jgi:ABC-type branched-subunit amino acid transport system ATPase component
LLWLAVVVLCGVRQPAGAIIAGLSIGLVPNLLNGGFTLPFGIASWSGTQDAQIPTLLFALGAVFLARQPDGFMQDLARRNFERRQRRRQRLASAESAAEERAATPVLESSVNGNQPPLACAGHLEVAGVTSGYGAVTIIRDLSLRLPKGGVLALLGPNGAGKSTTCKTIAGLLPVTAGWIQLNGTDVTAHPSWLRARNGIFLAPEGRGIFPSLSVDDNLRLLLPAAADREVIYERFEHLKRRRRVPAGNLSGGEQQMLALAPALVKTPALLIVDEPTLGLAPRVAQQVLDLFHESTTPESVIILAGESPRGLVDVADSVALLHAGRVVWTGGTRELDTQTLEQAYFTEGRI